MYVIHILHTLEPSLGKKDPNAQPEHFYAELNRKLEVVGRLQEHR